MATRQMRERRAFNRPSSLPCPSGGGIVMRRTVMEMMTASWSRVGWLGLCLCVLVTACSNAPALPALTPTASEPAQVAAITAYHGHTSTVYTLASRMERCRCGTRQAGGIGLPGEVKQLLSGPWRGHQAGPASPRRPAMTVTSGREKRCRYGTRRVGISSAAIRCRRAQPMLTGRLAWPGLPTAPVLPRAALIR